MYFQIFHNATNVIQRIRNLRYDIRIHTDTARVQHVNVGLAQAHRNKLPSYKDVALFFHLATYLMICTIKVTDARKSTTAQSVAI